MKSLTLTSLLLLIHVFMGAQSNATFTQFIPINTDQPLQFELEHPYIIKSYEGEKLLIETTVSLFNGGEETLRYLNRQGQYQLNLNREADGSSIHDNPSRRWTLINGGHLKESIIHVIHIPEGLTLFTRQPESLVTAK